MIVTESVSQRVLYFLAIILAVLGGVFAARNISGVLYLSFLSLVVAIIVVYRSMLRGVFSRVASLPPFSETHDRGADLFRLPRLIYYAALSVSGLLVVRPAFGFTLSDWVFLGSLGATFGLLLVGNKSERHWFRLSPTLYLGAGLFAVGGFLSSIHSPMPLQSAAVVIKFLYLTVLWFGLGTIVMRTQAHIRIAVCCWVFGTALSGAISIAQLAGFEIFHAAGRFYGRQAGAGGNPNDLGAQCAIALVPAIAAVTSDWAKGKWRIALALAVISLLAGLILSGSNTAFLAAALGLTLWFGAMGKINGKSILMAVLGAIAIIGILDFQSDQGALSPLDRFRSATGQDGAYCTSCERIETNKVAWEQIQEQPLIGRGLDGVGNRTASGSMVHFMVLKAWYEAGIMGFFGIILILSSIVVVGINCIRHARSLPTSKLAFSMIASFAAFIAVGLAQPLLYERYAWIPGAMIIAMGAQQRGLVSISFRRKGHAPESIAASWPQGAPQDFGF